ncbi:MAG: hypothetical protein AB1349_07550 [Elusimicrobiota bacterium]
MRGKKFEVSTMDKDKFQQVINDAFRNLTLCFGGIFLIHPVKDELIWVMMKSIEEVYLDACRKIDKLQHLSAKEKNSKNKISSESHPAIEKFLKKLESPENK